MLKISRVCFVDLSKDEFHEVFNKVGGLTGTLSFYSSLNFNRFLLIVAFHQLDKALENHFLFFLVHVPHIILLVLIPVSYLDSLVELFGVLSFSVCV
jgi:hypothetical protein